MIPIVEPDANQKDKRKGKKLLWKEAKISLAHPKGSRTPIYAATIEGGVEIAGGSFSNALFGPASARIPMSTRSETERLGSWARWKSDLACRAPT